MIQTVIELAGKQEAKRLVTLATSLGCADKYAGKRKKSRLKGELWMEASFNIEAEDVVQVSTHDISLGGMGFWLRKKVEVGDIVYLRDCSDAKPHPWMKVRVTHCVNGLKGYLIGGQFDFDQ